MLQKLKALYFAGRRLILLFFAIIVVVAVRSALAGLGYRLVRRLVPSTRANTAPPALARRVAGAVGRAAKFVPAASCLTQALSVQLILAVRGYSSEIRVGVARGDAGDMRAHAWVVCDNEIVIGGSSADIARYTPLIALPTRFR